MRLLERDGDISTYFDMDELTGDINIVTKQDVSGFMDKMARLRQDADERWRKGVKEEWMHYAAIPAVVIMELKNKGIDVFNPDDEKRLLQEININYPYLKLVNKRHE